MLNVNILVCLLVVQPQRHSENVDLQVHDECDDDISGTQFVCETVIRSLTLEEEPEHKPPRRVRANHSRPERENTCACYIPLQTKMFLFLLISAQ